MLPTLSQSATSGRYLRAGQSLDGESRCIPGAVPPCASHPHVPEVTQKDQSRKKTSHAKGSVTQKDQSSCLEESELKFTGEMG